MAEHLVSGQMKPMTYRVVQQQQQDLSLGFSLFSHPPIRGSKQELCAPVIHPKQPGGRKGAFLTSYVRNNEMKYLTAFCFCVLHLHYCESGEQNQCLVEVLMAL